MSAGRCCLPLDGVAAAPNSVIFQSAKLGDLSQHPGRARRGRGVVAAEQPDRPPLWPEWGRSGGAGGGVGPRLAARWPEHWGGASTALSDIRRLSAARAQPRTSVRSTWIRAMGVWSLRPLRRWLASRLRSYAGPQGIPRSAVEQVGPLLSRLGVPLYLCAMDRDGTLTLFGPPDEALQCPYDYVRVGPPRDAPILDATLAALSTMLSTAPTWVPDPEPTGGGRKLRGRVVPRLLARPSWMSEPSSPTWRRPTAPDLAHRPYALIRPWQAELDHLLLHHALTTRAQPDSAGLLLSRPHGTPPCSRCGVQHVAHFCLMACPRDWQLPLLRRLCPTSAMWTCPTSVAPRPSPICASPWKQGRADGALW